MRRIGTAGAVGVSLSKGLVVVGATFAVGCNPSGPPANLTFFSGTTENNSQIITEKIFPDMRTVPYGPADLGPGITGRRLGPEVGNFIFVRLQGILPLPSVTKAPSTKDRYEAVMFALDPSAYLGVIESDGATAIQAPNNVFPTGPMQWDLDTHVGGSDPFFQTSAPPGVSMEWDIPGTGKPDLHFIFSTDFYPFIDDPKHSFGAGISSDIDPLTGRTIQWTNIQAAYVYDHGQCSRAQAIAPVINQHFNSIKPTENLDIAGANASITTNWARAANWLVTDPALGAEPFGGFSLAADATATVDASSYHRAAYNEYTFKLDARGGIFVQGGVPIIEGALPGPENLITQGIQSHIVDGLAQVAQDATDSIQSNQWVDLFQPATDANGNDIGPSPLDMLGQPDCEPSIPVSVSCVFKMAIVGDLARDGLLKLDPTAIANANAQASIVATARDPANWGCREVVDTVAGPGGVQLPVDHHRCMYFVPAKRLLPFPDAVEAVWFDEEEPTNPAYAIWAVINQAFSLSMGAEDFRSKLCNFKLRTADSTAQRFYVSKAFNNPNLPAGP